MTVLNDRALKAAVASGLVMGLEDPRVQIQQCGVELTLGNMQRYDTGGSIGFDNKDRSLPRMSDVPFDGIGGFAHIMPGAYLVTFRETISLSHDIMAIARPRSSLLRMGVTVETAVFDPGYNGIPSSMLVVSNPRGLAIKQGARLIQLIFMTLTEPAEIGYAGIYQNEGLKPITREVKLSAI